MAKKEKTELSNLGESLGQEHKKLDLMFKNKENEADLVKAKREAVVLTAEVKETGDKNLLKKHLQWMRSRKLIEIADDYLLNEMEAAEIETEAEYVNKIGAAGYHVEIGQTVKYRKHYDEGRACDMYTFYPVREIPPEHQESRQLEWKRRNGIMPSESDFAQTRHVTHRFQLRESEFVRYFKEL